MFKKNQNGLRSIRGGAKQGSESEELSAWMEQQMLKARNSPGWNGDHQYYTEEFPSRKSWGKYLLIVLVVLLILIIVGYLLIFPH